MAIGMTYEEFWYESPDKAVMFLEAHKIRQKQRNEELWLQGLYTYIAISSVAPVLQAFAKKGTKPIPYIRKPLALTQEDAEKQKEEERLARKQHFIARMLASSRKGGSNNG